MKRNVSLYIADTKVDLDDESLILFNYTKDDLSNPTAVKNSYSHKVTLKGTAINNKLFGDIFRLDRQTLYSAQYKGAFFDPMRKTPFQIFDETSRILESGYIKLDSVNRSGDDVSYTITLFGGLGSFFYGLTYNEDGTKRTLADLSYKAANGDRFTNFSKTPSSAVVQEAWNYLADPNSYRNTCWNVVNFAPCYNGIPENFDANKALIRGTNIYANGPSRQTVGGVEYYQRTGTSSNLATFTNPHTEWEVFDLRWYLQRPIISMAAIIEAICYSGNNGGYEVELDSSFFQTSNAAYGQTWVTLPILSKDDRKATLTMSTLLRATLSPAEYLLSYAKVYGLVFKYDISRKKVLILSRNTFYNSFSDVVDLSKRIDKSEPIEINPIVATSKWYQFGGKIEGQFAEEYQKDYNMPYGSQKINTGYEFDSTVVDLTKDVVYKDAVEVLEKSKMFVYKSGRTGSQIKPTFMLPAYERVFVQLWGNKIITPESSRDIETDLSGSMLNGYWYPSAYDIGATVTITKKWDGSWRSLEYAVKAGERYRISGKGGVNGRLYCYVNSAGILKAIAPAETAMTDYILSIPENGLLYCSSLKTEGLTVYKIETEIIPAEYEHESIDNDMKASDNYLEYDNPSHPYSDWLPKVQLHGEENKTLDGSNVMILFDGVKKAPTFQYGSRKYYLTNDSEDMNILNGGNPCWDMTGDGVALTSLPSFRRNLTSGSDIVQSLEWGVPLARAVPDLKDIGRTIYGKSWKAYLTDLYDDDTRIMKCKVNLRGLQIGQELLQRFFWYGGSIWVLNKINNYSITTFDDAECEFIKVNDMANYKTGQIVG